MPASLSSIAKAGRCAEEGGRPLAHEALFYRSDEEYLDGILRFVRPGLAAREPVAMALPPHRAESVRDALAPIDAPVEIFDMSELGRNPAWIIPAVQQMLDKHDRRPLHYVGEPIWQGRSDREIREATRHEALINLAWADERLRVLCPYDVVALDPWVVADAERTHPHVIRDGSVSPSDAYCAAIPPACERALSSAPQLALALRFDLSRLAVVRRLVGRHAALAGLDQQRTNELVLAVNEVATNTIKHSQAPGLLRMWSEHDRVICQIEDEGHIEDPLAGRHRPVPTRSGGLGLWIVNQVCDLVEVRTSENGTTVRLHMQLS